MKTISLVFLFTLWVGQAQAIPLPNQQPLKSYECEHCTNLPREPLNFSWVTKISSQPPTSKRLQKSRKYKLKASLSELQKGVAIYTHAPGAIIRITPVNNKTTLNPEFYIKNNRGVNLSLMEASALFSKEEALKNTAFEGNTLNLSQLKPELGFGEFILHCAPVNKAPSQVKNEDQFIIHVFDQNSHAYLSVETDKARYHFGDELVATFILHNNKLNFAIDSIKASLVNASGESIPLDLNLLAENIYQSKTTLLSEKNDRGGNWYIEVEAETSLNSLPLKRQAHTAFSYVIPSATIREIRMKNNHSWDFSASIDVATDSRYALQAILYGSDIQGKIQPIQTIQSAAWLTAGQHELHFSFDLNLKTDYKAPYYLGYIHLTDFGQLKSVFEYDKPIALIKLS